MIIGRVLGLIRSLPNLIPTALNKVGLFAQKNKSETNVYTLLIGAAAAYLTLDTGQVSEVLRTLAEMLEKVPQ